MAVSLRKPIFLSASSPKAPQSSADAGVKISVQGLTKRATNGSPLLEGVSLQIMAGEVHGLIGPSGSGKTTVLRALNRMWEPPAGAVFFDGLDVTQLDVIQLRRRGLWLTTSGMGQL